MKRTIKISSILIIGLLITSSAFSQISERRGGISDDPQSKTQEQSISGAAISNVSAPCNARELMKYVKDGEIIELTDTDKKKTEKAKVSVDKAGNVSFKMEKKGKPALHTANAPKMMKQAKKMRPDSKNSKIKSKKQKASFSFKKAKDGKTEFLVTKKGKPIGAFVMSKPINGVTKVTCQ